MSPLRLPQTKSVFSNRPYSAGVIDSLFKLIKGETNPSGWILQADAGDRRLLLFILQNSPFAAAQIVKNEFQSLNLRDFFQTLSSLGKPSLTLYATNPLFFKCLLVSIQKVPTTTGTTDLLNIEHLLKQIKSSKKEVAAVLRRSDEMNLFYFVKGELQDAFFVNPGSVDQEISSEDQFLEYSYAATGGDPVTVQVYYDVQVRPAEDTDLPWQEWPGGIVAYFLRARPELIFLSGGESVDKRIITKSPFTIGRNPKSDLVIHDTLASRDHAVIRESRGKFLLEDNKSRNATMVNQKKISTVTLADGDEIQIGDYRIMFVEKSSVPSPKDVSDLEAMETTVIKLDDALLREAAAAVSSQTPIFATLGLEMLEGKSAGTRYPLKKKTIIGRSKADINTNDPKTSRHHAAIELKEDGYHFMDLRSTNGSLLNDKEVQSQRLSPGDIIKIGDTSFKVIEENP